MKPIRKEEQAYRNIATAHPVLSLSSPQFPDTLNMNGQGHEYFGGRQNQGQPLQNRARDQGNVVGYGRQSRNSDSYDMASIHDNREEDLHSRCSYNPAEFPPRLPYSSTQISGRFQDVSKMPDPYSSSQKTFPKARAIDPQHQSSVGHVIPSQPLRLGVPNRSSTHGLLQRNLGSISSSRHIDPSSIEGSPLLATSHQKYQQCIGHRSSTDAIRQGLNSAHPPNIPEISEEEYISSHTQPLHVKSQHGADSKPHDSVRFINGQMEYREANENIWKAAVYHEELRDTLIAEASLLGVYG